MSEKIVSPFHEVFCSLSALQMYDTAILYRHGIERDHKEDLRRSKMHEETATLNLVRRSIVASQIYPTFKFGAILHSRILESSSGADLEMSLRFDSGWLNLVLQAKLLHPPKAKAPYWSYQSWKSKQNVKLIKWCKNRSTPSKQLVPGMLLYNHPVPEITSRTTQDPFGACSLAQDYIETRLIDHYYTLMCPAFPAPPLMRGDQYRTPAGISVCLDEGMMRDLNAPSMADITRSHFPLEHLAHFENHGSGQTRYQAPFPFPGASEVLSENGPEWAEHLLEGVPPQEVDSGTFTDVEALPVASVALDLRT
ncbi:hypothetical protein ACUW8P_001993 [Corynebacterium afermentans]